MSRRFPWLPCLVVFVLAFAIRLYFVVRAPQEWIRPSSDWELDSIAISLVTKGQFADAYAVPSGPTAHLPPVPPLLLALILKIFGISLTAGYVEWILNMLFQAAIWGMLPWIGERVGVGWKAGLTGGLAGAFFPQWMGHGGALAAVFLGFLAVALVQRWDAVRRPERDGSLPSAATGSAPGPVSSLLIGAAFGVSFHVQPVFLPVFLGYLVFELWWRSNRGKWRSAGLVLLAAFVTCIPWGVRNYRAFDAVFFVRSNFGLELHIGNHEGATANIDDPHYGDYGYPRDWSHPRLDVEDATEIRDAGEVAYMGRKGRQAVAWIKSNPREFTRLTVERIGHFWLGPLGESGLVLLYALLLGLAILGAVRILPRLPGSRSALLLIPLLTYPLVYYLVPWQQRYRFPIEWILFLLAGAALWSWPGSRLGANSGTTGIRGRAAESRLAELP